MENTIFSRFLKALGVRHTTGYSDTRFLNIPFNTLFGFSRLCAEYKIPTAGYKLSDKSAMPAIPTPFIANTSGGLVIVRKMDDAVVEYDSQGALLNMDTPSFIKAADGIVFIASPDRNSEEPDYKKHLLSLRLSQGKQILMWVLLFSLAAFMIITDGLYRSLPAIILILLDAAGIFFSTLLVRKGLNHKSTTADKVCGIIQKGGATRSSNLKPLPSSDCSIGRKWDYPISPSRFSLYSFSPNSPIFSLPSTSAASFLFLERMVPEIPG